MFSQTRPHLQREKTDISFVPGAHHALHFVLASGGSILTFYEDEARRLVISRRFVLSYRERVGYVDRRTKI